MEKTKILIVDDEKHIAELISLYLTKEGFETREVYDGRKAMDEFYSFKPELVLLDLMLPGVDGYQICTTIRKNSDVPIIMLTARSDTFDKVLGLEMGADDYIVKPFEIVELLARVDVVLRRYRLSDEEIRICGLDIDTRSMRVTRAGQEIALTRKEYELLLFFARNPNTALYRETIYERVWGGEFEYGSKTVDLHVQRLRKKVGWTRELQAVNKVGYRLEVKE